MPSKKRVTISLTKKANGTYKLVVDPIDIWIKTAAEEITWKSTGADVQASFDKDGCPFSQQQFFSPVGTELGATGEPVTTGERKYAYKLVITPNPPIALGNHGDMRPIVIDPEGVLDDGGPPGSGRRRRASKKRRARKGRATKGGAKKGGAKKSGRKRKPR